MLQMFLLIWDSSDKTSCKNDNIIKVALQKMSITFVHLRFSKGLALAVCHKENFSEFLSISHMGELQFSHKHWQKGSKLNVCDFSVDTRGQRRP